MDMEPSTLRENSAKDSIWREKYLESLDAQEKESAAQQETINTLRRGLLSVSLVGDGIDQDLDTALASLRRQLHKLDQHAELNSLLATIEEKLLELDNRKIQKADGMLTLLDIAALSLSKLRFAQPHKRAIRRFTRKLKKPDEDPDSQLALLEAFITLCVGVFGELLDNETNPPTGFWASLFSKKATPNPSKTAPSAALDLGDDTEYREEKAVTTIGSETPVENSPVKDADQPPIIALENESTGTNTSDQTELYPTDSEKMVKEFIYQLLDNIDSADAIQAVAQQLRNKLLASQSDELGSVLTQITNLLDLAAANDRNTLRKYLEELNASIGQLSQFISHSKGHNSSLQKLDRNLDKNLRLKLSSIHTNIESVGDLTEMKITIKNQLDEMVVALDESKQKKSQSESEYLTQLNSLASKFEAVELESKQLKQVLEDQKRAAEFDSLTKLPNRFAFHERLTKELETLSVTTDPVCLAIGDVDEFEQLNTRFGFNAGDKALQLITKQMQKHLSSDDFLARYSSDKFVLLMPLKSAQQGIEKLHAICEEIRHTPFRCKSENISITLSFGLTELAHKDNQSKAFDRAKAALESAKTAGGDDCAIN